MTNRPDTTFPFLSRHSQKRTFYLIVYSAARGPKNPPRRVDGRSRCAASLLTGTPNGTSYPVSGKVTLDGKPLPDAQISLVANTEKGNQTKATPFGMVKDGSYSLTSNDKPGAPAGLYNVMILTEYPGGPEKPVVLPKRYSDPGRSRLSVEVTPSPKPGAYDLTLTSQ